MMEVDHEPKSVENSECTGTLGKSRKRKQPDEEEVLLPKVDPLVEDQIDNEYEHLDDDDEVDESGTSKVDYEEILKAQEAPTIAQYDDVKITPFNLEEELEEGEFDATGNFIFNKDKNKNKDDWADSIDWSEVERQEKLRKEKLDNQSKGGVKDGIDQGASTSTSNGSLSQSSKPLVQDRLSCYKEMLRIMKPDETVQKCIRRLGNAVPKRKPQTKFNKNKQRTTDESTGEEEKSSDLHEVRRKLDLMIELAHLILEDGDMDIYQKAYEDLEDAIN